MKNWFTKLVLLLSVFLALFIPGCDVISDIFTAGVWVGVIVVVLVIALIIFLIVRLFKWLK